MCASFDGLPARRVVCFGGCDSSRNRYYFTAPSRGRVRQVIGRRLFTLMRVHDAIPN
jgi:hypothetical protein